MHSRAFFRAMPRRQIAIALCLLPMLLGACATMTEVRESPPMPAAAPAPEPPQPPASPAAPATPALPIPAPPPPEAGPPPPTTATPLPVPAVLARPLLRRYLPERVLDPDGWANDIVAAFAALHIATTPENICSVVAVTEQESMFVADPRVPGLAKIAWKEIELRRSRYGIPRLVLDAALKTRSPDGRSYRERIDALRTETQMNALYQDMISELPFGRTLLAGRNPIRTGGPMQVSVAFAEEHAVRHGYPYPVRRSIRDEVFTRRGGMYFGIAILLDYAAPYAHPVHRFADFNAGRYSSRNAAFQLAVSAASGTDLVPDGDLLRYRDGRPASGSSETQRALNGLAGALSMTTREIERDLASEKRAEFSDTRLYARVFSLAERRKGLRFERAVIPRIELKSPKITRKLTTQWFAQRVKWRYESCLSRGSQ